MSSYGILISNPDWANQAMIEIEKATYLHHQQALDSGTKTLIYLREPVDAVVASAEITGAPIETDSAAPDMEGGQVEHMRAEAAPPTSSAQALAHAYYVPLKITRLKGQTPPISLNRLQKTLGGEFSVYDETWIPLSREQYEAITADWDEEQLS